MLRKIAAVLVGLFHEDMDIRFTATWYFTLWLATGAFGCLIIAIIVQAFV